MTQEIGSCRRCLQRNHKDNRKAVGRVLKKKSLANPTNYSLTQIGIPVAGKDSKRKLDSKIKEQKTRIC
jgi:hypothetical protein